MLDSFFHAIKQTSCYITHSVYHSVLLFVVCQCEVQKEELSDLRDEVQQWQQEAQEQKESRVKEVQALKEELQSTQSRLRTHRDNQQSLCRELETAHRQQRDTEDEVRQLSRLHFHYFTTSASKYKCLCVSGLLQGGSSPQSGCRIG